MLISIKNLIRGMVSSIDIDNRIRADELDLNLDGIMPTDTSHFIGQLETVGDGVLTLSGELTLNYGGVCARCLEDVRRQRAVAIRETFRPAQPERDTTGDRGTDTRSDEDDDNRYRGFVLDIGPILREHIVLAMPSRLLCREDCLGLCPVCGRDRNIEPCDCQPEADTDD